MKDIRDSNDSKYVSEFETKVLSTINDYKLLSLDDKIVVALSGGKDSVAVLYILKKYGYDVTALTLDVEIGAWSRRNQDNIRRICAEFGVELVEVTSFEVLGHDMRFVHRKVQEKLDLENCAICGIVKRWVLNRWARDLSGTKLVTGHNLDDEAQTLFMNMIKGNPALSIGLGPRTGVVSDDKFVSRVKPLYFFLNDEVERYTKALGFVIQYEKCPASSSVFRREIKNHLDALEKDFPGTKMSIVRNYLDMKPRLVKAFSESSKGGISYCKLCGEPTRNELCKMCEVLKIVKG